MSVQTKTLDRVIAIAKALPAIGAQRAVQGYTRYAEDQNWEALLAGLSPGTQGYFSAWLKECSELSAHGPGRFTIVGELAVACPKDASTSLSAEWELCLQLASALLNPAAYQDGEIEPLSVSVRLHQVSVTGGAGLALFDFGAYGGGGLKFNG